MDDQRLQRYLRAGRIAAQTIGYAESLLRSQKNLSYYDLCEKVEGFIEGKGGIPAFPCNVGVNEVTAHFSPLTREEGTLPEEGLVKVDVGVRIDGCIVDTATTVPLSPEFRSIVEVNKFVLEEAIKLMRPGEKTGRIGGVIEAVAKARNYKTIRNLSGHLISEYSLHGGKAIPNVGRPFTPKMKADEIYAVEPFLTFPNAHGEVVDTDKHQIFQIVKLKRPGDRDQANLYDHIVKRYDRLPFSPRWLRDLMPMPRLLEVLEVMRKGGILHAYPILVEKSGKPVAQFEHTVVVREEGPLILTE
ncbi:MAG: M24 family metallopeptidase [Candidatus Geothermarchaeales archaeon]